MRRGLWPGCNDLLIFAMMRSNHWWGRATTLACLVALSLAGVLAQTAWAQANIQDGCPAGLEPYTASAETLTTCGDRIVPRIALTSLPNGAVESVYLTPQSKKVRFITPPGSFRSSTASPAELELYGVPAEPAKDSPEYPQWQAMIANGIHFEPPPDHLIEGPNSQLGPAAPDAAGTPSGLNTGSTTTWGGYVNDVPIGSNENAYTKVTGYYKEPAGSQTFECPSPASAATWVGLGGYAGNQSLGQDGTVLRWEDEEVERGHHEGFYEVEPHKVMWLGNFFGSPGYFVKAETTWSPSEGAYHFYLYNYKTKAAVAPKAEGTYDGETADFIVERQTGHELFDFEKVTFQAFTNGKAFQESPTERVEMTNGKEENVRVSNIVNKYEFNVKFKSCKKPGTKEETEYSQLGNGRPAPKVTTGGSSEVTGSTAKAGGTVNPEGDNAVYQFEYGTEADNFEASSLPQSAGEGSTTVPVSASLTGLRSGTTYYYRLVASSGNGARDGEERTFKTTGSPPPPPPTVTTEAPTEVRDESATLAASVNPNGADTHYYFEYGPNSTLLERSVPAPPGNDAGAGTTSVREGVEAPGLLPSTTYYYRVVASNSTGTSYGEEKSFTTPSVWSVQATPNPHGTLESDKLGGVSCWSATACVAVGLYVETLDVAVPLVEGWNGTTWEVESAPAPAGATRSQFESVSCTSATACMAVGYYENGSSVELPLAEQWNGTTWAVTTVPNPEGNESPLRSVSCTSANACTAVGWTAPSGSTSSALAERWNGKVWKIETTATISGTHEGVSFEGVSCAATEACIAAGQYNSSSSTTAYVTLAERWNGKTWTQQTTPNPGGSTGVLALRGISCSSTVACTAVGEFRNGVRSFNALIEHWNGTTWEIQSSPNPTGAAEEFGQPSWGLQAVSCFSATACTAVGSYDDGSGVSGPSLGERWNGTLWEPEEPANPTGVESSYLLGVSCPAATICTAAGYSETFFGNDDEPSVTLAERLLAPNAETEAATSVTATGAVLNGTVNPEGVEATYRFEYGTSTAYGTKVPIPNASAGSGTSGIKASQTLSALLPKTTYHFRLVAASAIGTIEGSDQTFTTP